MMEETKDEGPLCDTEGPYALPEGWVWATIEQLYKIVGGGTPATSIAEYWNGDIPWITSADITGLHNITPRKYITTEAIKHSATNLVPAGSLIVVTRVGLGKVALTKTPLCFSQDAHALIGDPSVVDPGYAIYFLSEAVQTFKYHNQGTTIAGVTKKQLANLPFVLPPIDEQRRIVAKIEELLSALDAGVAGLKRVQAALKRYRAAVLKAACEGRLVPQAPNDEPAEKLLERILAERRAKWEADLRAKGKDPAKAKYEEPKGPAMEGLPELPEGWCWARVEQFAEVRLGRQRSPARSVGPNMRRYLRAANVTWSGLDLSDVKEMDFTPTEQVVYRLKVGDILLSEASGSIGEVGKPGVWHDQLPECYFQNTLIRIRSEGPLPDYLYVHFLFDALTERFRIIAKGVGIHHLGAENFASYVVALPPLDAQPQIVNSVELRLSQVRELERTVENSMARAERLRQAILRRAFEGKLAAQNLVIGQ